MTRDESKHSSTGDLSSETVTAQALGRVDEATRALVLPIHTSATYERDPDGGYSSGRGYSRPHNPTYDEPEELLARLEGGRDCLLLASGMAACTAVFQSLLPGDHVVAPRVMYWALRKWLVEFAMPWGLEVEFVETGNRDALAAAMRPGQTRLVWIESPANPMWNITDITVAAEIAHGVRARLAVDSTVATPVLTRPIELGADLVVHSASKYLNGHSDVVAGAIVCAQQDSFWQRVRAWRRDAGAVLGPFEAYLLLRGMRTLFVRVRRCCENAMTIAKHFEGHPLLGAVLYPGLRDHPGHACASRQMEGGYGGMLSIRHRHGESAAMSVAAHVRVFKRATSLGGIESLIEHRASIEGPSTPVPADLLRLSIGLEDPTDLIADLEQALERSLTDARAEVRAPAHREAPTGHAHDTGDESTAELERLIQQQIRPLVLERGGDLELARFANGVVELAFSGSPGATVPIEKEIRNLIRHYLPNVTDVRLIGGRAAEQDAKRDAVRLSPTDRLRRLLDESINPAVAAHGGVITLVGVEGGTARIRFERRCQGCAMADVTLRQGVEVMVKAAIPEIIAIVDTTDHTQGTDPYFKTKKS
jgi:cystathionine gamma-synthase